MENRIDFNEITFLEFERFSNEISESDLGMIYYTVAIFHIKTLPNTSIIFMREGKYYYVSKNNVLNYTIPYGMLRYPDYPYNSRSNVIKLLTEQQTRQYKIYKALKDNETNS